MKHSVISAVVLALVLPASASIAGGLPKGAKPLTEQQVKGIYVGNTVKYKYNGSVYYTWMADGTLLGISDNANGSHSWADGSWTVKGNTFCFESHWKNAAGKTVNTYAPCKAWYKVGKATWTKSVSGDGEYNGETYDDEIRKFTKGDKLSARLEKVKSSMK